MIDPLDPPFNFTRKEFNWPPLFPAFPMMRNSLFRKDLYLNAYYISYKPQNIIKLSNLDLNDQDNSFLQRWREENEEVVPFSGRYMNVMFKTLNNGSKFDSNTLKTSLSEGLRDLKLVWLLIDRFFNSELNIGLPYVNKASFIKSVKELIGSKTDSKTVNLEVENLTDLATIGVLLIIMIVTSTSLYNFNKEFHPNETKDEDLQYILDHKVSDGLHKVLTNIDKELKTSDPQLSTYCFFVMFTYFQVFDTDAFDCIRPLATDRTLFLFDLGTHFSLNIDPDELDEIPNNEKNYYRRLWYGIINLDLYQTLYVGGQRMIRPQSYNTKLPQIEGVDDEEKILNRVVVTLYDTYNHHFSPIIDLLLNIQVGPSLSQVVTELSNFEKRVQSLKTLEEVVFNSAFQTIEHRIQNFLSIHNLILSDLLLFMVYHHIHILYSTVQKNMKLSLEYLLKALHIFHKIFNLMCFFDTQHKAFNFQRLFGTGFFIFPTIDTSIRSTYLILFVILGRLNSEIFVRQSFTSIGQEKLGILNNIARNINYIIEDGILENYGSGCSIYYRNWTFIKIEGHMMRNALHDFLKVNSFPNSLLKYNGYISENRSKSLSYTKIDIEDLKKFESELYCISQTLKIPEEQPSQHGLTPYLNNLDDAKLLQELENSWLERVPSDALYANQKNIENSTKRQRLNGGDDDSYSLNTPSTVSPVPKNDNITLEQQEADTDNAIKEVEALLKFGDITELDMI